MNRTIASALVVAAAAFAGSAFADDITIETNAFHSTKTRAQVQAELAQYKATGTNWWSTQYNPLKTFKSDRTRADVVAEYISDRDEVAARNGEDSGSAYFAHATFPRTDASTTLAGQPRNPQ
jgi:hypothetical protein